MNSERQTPRTFAAFVFLFLLFAAPTTTAAQDARDIMQSAHFCDMITLDSTGRPRSREMDPFAPDSDMVVWLGTNRLTRKVNQIRNDPRVTLHYFSPAYYAYVTIAGTAELVDDPVEKEHRWKEGWARFYPDRSAYLLIKVTPQWMEVLSGKHHIPSEPALEPPRVTF